MSLSARPPLAVRARLRALASASRAYALGTLRVIAMFLRNPGLLPLALSAPLVYRRARTRPSSDLPPLTRVAEGIWRVPVQADADLPEQDDEPAQCVVLHYTGTGESVHAAYENTQHLFAAEPRLARAPHFVFEAPLSQGAYYGAERFSATLWERVEPIVAHYDGPFLLLGVSRGGLAALDHGMRVVEECGKLAAVLTLSAPLDMPKRVPVSIRTIADFADVLTIFSDVWSDLYAPLRDRLAWIIRNIYVMLTALVLRHHGVYDPQALTRNARDLTDHGVLQGSLRATREFRLLLRVSERELTLFRQMVVRALYRHRDRFFATLVWGKKDVWIDAQRCQARMLEAAHTTAPALALHTSVLADQGHLLSARDRGQHGAQQAELSELVCTLLAAHARRVPELDPTLSLRAAHASPEGSDD